ncbi:MAG: metalloregulator ArsR/SmtB family transcription factor [Haliscomenobacter sp.]|nr:metalloregulator ArsR/SmtB family transcription factor [Haliscomenobacter sp.]
MHKRDFKDAAYTEISRIAKAMASPARLEIVDFIANGEKCVEDIALQTKITIANASQHLQTLTRERLVRTRKHGVQVFYSLASPEVYRAWTSLRDLTLALSPHLREAMDHFRVSNAYDLPVSLEEIAGRPDVCLLDVRPEDEFQKGHLRKPSASRWRNWKNAAGASPKTSSSSPIAGACSAPWPTKRLKCSRPKALWPENRNSVPEYAFL